MAETTFQNTDIENVVKGLETGKFYFLDETWDINGPYDDAVKAKEALDLYCKEVLGPAPYSPVGTQSGRVSSKEPNLANAPRELKEE